MGLHIAACPLCGMWLPPDEKPAPAGPQEYPAAPVMPAQLPHLSPGPLLALPAPPGMPPTMQPCAQTAMMQPCAQPAMVQPGAQHPMVQLGVQPPMMQLGAQLQPGMPPLPPQGMALPHMALALPAVAS